MAEEVKVETRKKFKAAEPTKGPGGGGPGARGGYQKPKDARKTISRILGS